MSGDEKARERELDWALGEVVGGESPPDLTSTVVERLRTNGGSKGASGGAWLRAAVLLLGLGIVAVVATKAGEDTDETGGQDREWACIDLPPEEIVEVRSAAEVEALPADTKGVRCFDFTDEEVRSLSRLQQLEHLDLSGMDVNKDGYSVALKISDAAVASLGAMPRLHTLILDGCHDVSGAGLSELDGSRLATLSASYCRFDDAGLAAVSRFLSLERLDLSGNFAFASRSLKSVGKLKKLRELSLARCFQIRGGDMVLLVGLDELRSLDLSGCGGRFRGSVVGKLAQTGDGVGVDSAALILIGAMSSVVELNVANCPSVGDRGLQGLVKHRIGGTLRSLTLTGNHKVTVAGLKELPGQLATLRLGGCAGVDAEALTELLETRLRGVRELDLSELPIGDMQLGRVLDAPREVLALRGCGKLTRDVFGRFVIQPSLRQLDLSQNSWVDEHGLQQLGASGSLVALILNRIPSLTDEHLRALTHSRLTSLSVNWCEQVTHQGLWALRDHPLQSLRIYGSEADPAIVEEAAARHWPGCEVTMPDGRRWMAPR